MAAPTIPATCALWPQAWAAPVRGSAWGWSDTRSESSSPRMARVGPEPPQSFRPLTPVTARPC